MRRSRGAEETEEQEQEEEEQEQEGFVSGVPGGVGEQLCGGPAGA